MQQFKTNQTTNLHHADLRAQARAERMMDKQTVSAVTETLVDGFRLLDLSQCCACSVRWYEKLHKKAALRTAILKATRKWKNVTR